MCFEYAGLENEGNVALFSNNLKYLFLPTNFHNEFYYYEDVSSDTSFFKDILSSTTNVTHLLRLQSHAS